MRIDLGTYLAQSGWHFGPSSRLYSYFAIGEYRFITIISAEGYLVCYERLIAVIVLWNQHNIVKSHFNVLRFGVSKCGVNIPATGLLIYT